ncbi:MAG: hypothetical protein IJH25_17620, partial [Clostridia bacterium]|nr:hypothetical protein [Clostridia bacterium]
PAPAEPGPASRQAFSSYSFKHHLGFIMRAFPAGMRCKTTRFNVARCFDFMYNHFKTSKPKENHQS